MSKNLKYPRTHRSHSNCRLLHSHTVVKNSCYLSIMKKILLPLALFTAIMSDAQHYQPNWQSLTQEESRRGSKKLNSASLFIGVCMLYRPMHPCSKTAERVTQNGIGTGSMKATLTSRPFMKKIMERIFSIRNSNRSSRQICLTPNNGPKYLSDPVRNT